MDKTVFVQNVKLICLNKGIKPTNACKESGVGGSFLSDINRGQVPSVAKVQMLAEYLGVSTSELLGEKIEPTIMDDDWTPSENELIFRSLPPERQEEVLRYMRYLVAQEQEKKAMAEKKKGAGEPAGE